MKKILVLVADGSEEIETTTIVNVLRRAGLQVTLAGIAGKLATGSRGITLGADALLAECGDCAADYDALVLPGGWEGTLAFCADVAVQETIRQFCDKGKLTAAICAAPMALDRAGVLNGKKFTCYPGLQGQISAAQGYQTGNVVKDGNIMTSCGPATAMEFALALAGELAGAVTAEKIAGELLYKTA